jgi:hypothetical protein
MTPEERAPGYEFRSAWRSGDPAIEADAIAFWERLRLLPQGVSPEERARQLVAAAYKDGQLAGVLSAKIELLQQVRARFAMIRIAVDPAHRRAYVSRALTLASYDLLHRWGAAHPDERLAGIAAFIESRELADYGRRPYWPETKFILAGFLPDGRQLRIAWFEDFPLDCY